MRALQEGTVAAMAESVLQDFLPGNVTSICTFPVTHPAFFVAQQVLDRLMPRWAAPSVWHRGDCSLPTLCLESLSTSLWASVSSSEKCGARGEAPQGSRRGSVGTSQGRCSPAAWLCRKGGGMCCAGSWEGSLQPPQRVTCRTHLWPVAFLSLAAYVQRKLSRRFYQAGP